QIVLLLRVLKRIVFGMVRLNEDFAGTGSAAGSARNLREQLKRAFRRSKVRHTETRIDRDHGHKSHVGEIVPFCDHLRAYENVYDSCREVSYQPLVASAPARGVAIQTGDIRFGKLLLDQRFELLGAFADVVDVLPVAGGAELRHARLIVAIVADQTIDVAMICERDVAIATTDRQTATSTDQKRRISAPIEKYDRLLVARFRLGDGLQQFVGEDLNFSVPLEDLAHID